MAPKNKIVRTGLGTVAVRSEEELDISRALGDRAAPDVGVELQEQQLAAEREAAFDTAGDMALTFAEGVVDAISLGTIHEHGEQADIRRRVHSGSALLGTLVGTAAGLGVTSPVSVVAKGSRAVGRGVTGALLKESTQATAAGKILARGVDEAAIGAGLMGSTAFGHQLSDAIVEDKAFAGEAILHEMSLGGALGFGTGLLAGGFGHMVSRGKIRAQGGIVDPLSPESKSLVDEIRGVQGAWKDSAAKYDAQVGSLERLQRAGVIPSEMVAPYREAANRARAAVKALDNFNPATVFDAGTKEFNQWRQVMANANKRVREAGEVFLEPPSAARPQRLQVRPGPSGTADEFVPFEERYRGVDDIMRGDPEKLAAYERHFGRPFEFHDPVPTPGGIAPEVAGAGTANLRGPAGRVAREELPGGGYVERVDGGVTGMARRVGPAPEPAPSIRPDDSVPPSGEYTQVTPEGIPTRPVNVYGPDTLPGAPEFGPGGTAVIPRNQGAVPVAAADNAVAFAQFREAAALETASLSRPQNPLVGALEQPTARNFNAVRGDGGKTVRDANVPRGEPQFADDLGRTYKDPDVPRGEPLPKDAPDEATSVYSDVDDIAKTRVRPKPGSPEWEEFQRRAAENYVEKWYWESKAMGPSVSPADEAAARLDAAMRRLSEMTGGRLDSAGALELGERLGLRATDDAFVDRLDQVWALRKAAKFAADEARGVRTALRSSGKGMVEEVAQRYAARQMAAIIGGVSGGPLGAVAGWVLGKHLPGMIGFGGRAASSAGNIMQMIGRAGDELLRGRRGTVAARAIAGNRPYAYDDEGPVHNPVDRIQKIHRIAANPDQVRATVRNQLGDVALAAPAMASAIEETAVRQVTNLSLRAPAIYFDQLGRPIAPTLGQLRKFYEYENATHDLQALLASVGRGSVTPTQLAALAEQHQSSHGYLVKHLLKDPERLKRLNSAELRAVESVLGVPLSYAAYNPGHVGRVQAGWAQSQASGDAQAGKPQAFKISAPPPTPVQASTRAVAPGNE